MIEEAAIRLRRGDRAEGLDHKSPAVTLTTCSHLWPDASQRTRKATDALLGSVFDETAADGLRTESPLNRG